METTIKQIAVAVLVNFGVDEQQAKMIAREIDFQIELARIEGKLKNPEWSMEAK